MPGRFVLDASVSLAWFLPDASKPEQRYAEAIKHLILERTAVPLVPYIWHVEMAAVLLRNHRSKREGCGKIWLESSRTVMTALSTLTKHQGYSADEIIHLGLGYHLQGYDALYFDLAKTEGLPLATVDRGQITACKRFGVTRLAI